MKISFQETEDITCVDFKLNYSNQNQKYINGQVENLLAMEQVVYKILNTERYSYNIYSWNYGVEFVELLGKPVYYVCAEIERVITEALLQDDRISSVCDFSFDTSVKNVVLVEFVVTTIFGTFTTVKEVDY